MEHPDATLYLKGRQYLEIRVRHARTHIDDGKAQFTDYEIELKTNHIAFTVKTSKVRRRFSDFVWLRNRLIRDTMITDPPKLPSKQFFGRFKQDFIKQRQKKLQDFLIGIVQNNVYLSHTALHLFFQSKFTAEEIDDILDKNKEEEAVDAIVAESECKARLDGILNRNRIGSKHDSGIGDYEDDFIDDPLYIESLINDEADDTLCNNNNCNTIHNHTEEEIFSDGHTADVETESDNDSDSKDDSKSENEDTEEDKTILEELTRMRISSLPAPTPEMLHEDRFESSYEFDYDSSDSDTSCRKSARSSTKGSISDFKSKVSSQESVRNTPSKRKRRYSRQHSTQRKSLFNSNASLPEYHLTDNQCSDNPVKNRDKIKRSKSFYDYTHQKLLKKQHENPHESPINSDCKSPTVFGSHDSFNQTRRIRRVSSFLSSTERTPIKRKISLNEYIIVDRNSLNLSQHDFNNLSEKEQKFKSSL